ncbi:MAG: RNA pseudouridine synthase, partial [Prevotellaceae bacterium]|nr:RNA pseudouridine synthase [Prevotellaceae bacterium]
MNNLLLEEDFFPEGAAEEQDELFEHYRLTADKGQSLMRVDKYLVNCLTGNISRNRIQYAADAGRILVNDQPVKSNYRVKPNDVISVMMSHPPGDVVITPQDIPLNIVYEDDDILLVNKQPN